MNNKQSRFWLIERFVGRHTLYWFWASRLPAHLCSALHPSESPLIFCSCRTNMFVCVFRHGDAPNGPLPPERTNEFQSCCSQRAGSAQKMQRRPLTWRIFSPRAHKRKTILQLRRLWHCARGAAHRFLSLFKRQNHPSAKLILNKILMRLQRRLHALFATPSEADAYGSIKTESMWKPRRRLLRRARQGHARVSRAHLALRLCALCFVIQFNFLGMTRFTIRAHLSIFAGIAHRRPQ